MPIILTLLLFSLLVNFLFRSSSSMQLCRHSLLAFSALCSSAIGGWHTSTIQICSDGFWNDLQNDFGNDSTMIQEWFAGMITRTSAACGCPGYHSDARLPAVAYHCCIIINCQSINSVTIVSEHILLEHSELECPPQWEPPMAGYRQLVGRLIDWPLIDRHLGSRRSLSSYTMHWAVHRAGETVGKSTIIRKIEKWNSKWQREWWKILTRNKKLNNWNDYGNLKDERGKWFEFDARYLSRSVPLNGRGSWSALGDCRCRRSGQAGAH